MSPVEKEKKNAPTIILYQLPHSPFVNRAMTVYSDSISIVFFVHPSPSLSPSWVPSHSLSSLQTPRARRISSSTTTTMQLRRRWVFQEWVTAFRRWVSPGMGLFRQWVSHGHGRSLFGVLLALLLLLFLCRKRRKNYSADHVAISEQGRNNISHMSCD